MGLPMGGSVGQVCAGPAIVQAETTCVSVGPYSLCNRQEGRASNNAATLLEICRASAVLTTSRKEEGYCPVRWHSSAICCKTTNGRKTVWIFSSIKNCRRDETSFLTLSRGTTSVPPNAQTAKDSSADTSKLREENCSAFVSGNNRNESRCHSTRFTRARCVKTTPLGRPVEPEV